MFGRINPGHYAGARGCADWADGISPVERDAIGTKFPPPWAWDFIFTGTVVPEKGVVVCYDQQDVWLFIHVAAFLYGALPSVVSSWRSGRGSLSATVPIVPNGLCGSVWYQYAVLE